MRDVRNYTINTTAQRLTLSRMNGCLDRVWSVAQQRQSERDGESEPSRAHTQTLNTLMRRNHKVAAFPIDTKPSFFERQHRQLLYLVVILVKSYLVHRTTPLLPVNI